MTAKDTNTDPFAGLGTDQALFNSPKPASRKRKRSEVKKRPEGQKATRSAGRPADRPDDPPAERIVKRHGFDVYRDQVVALNELQFEIYRQTNKKPPIGKFVREAIDTFIAKEKRKGEG